MPLTTIEAAKETELSYQPLLIAIVTFPDATVLRLSTHPLNVAEGGFQYGGQDYHGRISSHDIPALQALSEQGIDQLPAVTLHLADADKWLMQYELAHGWRGALLEVRLVFWDADTATFSTNAYVKFSGVCSGANADDLTLTVSATARNPQKTLLPPTLIQKRCPWLFPATAAQKAEAGNPDSAFYRCGYTGVADWCDYTAQRCKALNNWNRFGGVQFDPPAAWRSKSYLEGKTVEGKNVGPDQLYGQPVPLVYGTAWVDCPVANTMGEGNSTHWEAIVCDGEVDDIIKVIAQDVEVPRTTSRSGTPYWVQDWLFCWRPVTWGTRDGSPNQGALYNGRGDSYGSICVIEGVVPKKLAESAGRPATRVLVRGPKIRTYSDPNTWTLTGDPGNRNPVWILMDLLVRSGWNYADLDIQSFIDAALYCDELVTYTNAEGVESTHPRYSCSIAIQDRRSAAQLIRGVRQAGNLILVTRDTDGKKQVRVKMTLADQQPAAVNGSNYNTPVPSKGHAGGAANGYVAYHFNESSILADDKGAPQARVYQEPLSDAPNRISFAFRDADNWYAEDSFTRIDTADVARIGQEIGGTFAPEGIDSYDAAKRISAIFLAETLRGNSRLDTGGTYYVEFSTTVKVAHLRAGDIVMLSLARYNWANQLFRVLKIQPRTDFETCNVTLAWHSDDWYTDAWGQAADPQAIQQHRNRLPRPAYPWAPYSVQPPAGDSMFAREDWTFGITQVYTLAADGTNLVHLAITGCVPVNQFASLGAPKTALQLTTANTGGTIPGGNRGYYVAVCGKDADGKVTAPSYIASTIVTDPGSTNTLTIAVPAWGSGTVGYSVFTGLAPHKLTWQVDGPGTPASIMLTAFKERTWGMPDVEFDHLRFRVKRGEHLGVVGVAVTSASLNTLTVDAAGWTVNQWVNYDCSIIAKSATGVCPVLDFRITANSATQLTVTPDPAALGVAVGDVMIIRSRPTVNGRTLTDANWKNSLVNNGQGLVPGQEVNRLLRIIAGPGRGQLRRIASNTDISITIDSDWHTLPTSDSRYIVEAPTWDYEVAAGEQENTWAAVSITQNVNVTNYSHAQLVIQVLAEDGGDTAFDQDGPVREAYVFGQAERFDVVTSDYTVQPDDQVIYADTTLGPLTVTLPPAGALKGRKIIVCKITGDANIATVAAAPGETINGQATVTLAKAWDYWVCQSLG